jgi:hypothetical protein
MMGRGQSRTITAVSIGGSPGRRVHFLGAAGRTAFGRSRFTVDLSAGASVDTNEDLDDPSRGTTTRTNLGATFGLLDETEVSRLAVSVFSRAEWANSPDPDEDGFDFRIPSGSLDYTRRGGTAASA